MEYNAEAWDNLDLLNGKAIHALHNVTAESQKLLARNLQLEHVLRTIQKWDCLNPPNSELCADHPWLKQLVDEAIADQT